MIKRVAIFLVLAVLGLLVFAATKPDTFRVQRSMTVNASPDKVFALVNDLHRWEAWSPWDKMDPEMKKSYSGPESGPGAAYEWDGNENVGKGKLEITKADIPNEIQMKLHFIEPFEANNDVDFTFEPRGESTEVTWGMQGPNPYFSKLMQVFLSMDRMIGKDFESGLTNLKNIAEKE